jgi:hypothetical protein
MQNRWAKRDRSKKRLLNRIDRVAGEMNVFLLIVAIGLAFLDFTCFFVLETRGTIPAQHRAAAFGKGTKVQLDGSTPTAIAAPTRPAGGW